MERVDIDVPSTSYAAVEYPGFVRNASKAVQTLGGAAAIGNAMNSEKGYMHLSFRPAEPTSHALYGERTNTNRLLLRIARPKDAPGGSAIDANAVTAQVVARVPTTFSFTGLADFQYVPYDPLTQERAQDPNLPAQHRPDKAEPSKTPQPFLLIPPLFSKVDVPQDYAFTQARARHVSKAPRPKPAWGDAPVISFYSEGVPPPAADAPPEPPPRPPPTQPQEQQAAPAAAADGQEGAALPGPRDPRQQQQPQGQQASPMDHDQEDAAAPAATAAEEAAVAAAQGQQPQQQDEHHLVALEHEVYGLLQQRPIWDMELMLERVNDALQLLGYPACDREQATRALQRFCYRFKTGPWRNLYIRRGYDPRDEPDARRYQTIAYRLPNDWYEHLTRPGMPNPVEPRQGSPLGAAAAGAPADEQAAAAVPAAAQAPRLTDVISFCCLPTSRTTTIQLVDVAGRVPAVQHAIDNPREKGPLAKCTEANGWFTFSVLHKAQAAVAQRYGDLMRQRFPHLAIPAAVHQQPAAAAAAAAAAGPPAADAAAAAGAAPLGDAALRDQDGDVVMEAAATAGAAAAAASAAGAGRRGTAAARRQAAGAAASGSGKAAVEHAAQGPPRLTGVSGAATAPATAATAAPRSSGTDAAASAPTASASAEPGGAPPVPPPPQPVTLLQTLMAQVRVSGGPSAAAGPGGLLALLAGGPQGIGGGDGDDDDEFQLLEQNDDSEYGAAYEEGDDDDQGNHEDDDDDDDDADQSLSGGGAAARGSAAGSSGHTLHGVTQARPGGAAGAQGHGFVASEESSSEYDMDDDDAEDDDDE